MKLLKDVVPHRNCFKMNKSQTEGGSLAVMNPSYIEQIFLCSPIYCLRFDNLRSKISWLLFRHCSPLPPSSWTSPLLTWTVPVFILFRHFAFLGSLTYATNLVVGAVCPRSAFSLSLSFLRSLFPLSLSFQWAPQLLYTWCLVFWRSRMWTTT